MYANLIYYPDTACANTNKVPAVLYSNNVLNYSRYFEGSYKANTLVRELDYLRKYYDVFILPSLRDSVGTDAYTQAIVTVGEIEKKAVMLFSVVRELKKSLSSVREETYKFLFKVSGNFIIYAANEKKRLLSTQKQ